jgi:lambda repressor-like predicted transcriptional regulator
MLAKVTVMHGPWIEDRLHELGWTQADLARHAELHADTVRRALRGEPIWVSSMHKLIETLTNHRPNPEIEAAVVKHPRHKPVVRPVRPKARPRRKAVAR